LTGWAGQVSLGQMAVASFGAAAAGSVGTVYHWDLALSLAFGGVFGAVALLAVGLPSLRSGGLSLGIATLALTIATTSLVTPAWAPWFYKDRLVDPYSLDRPRLFGRIRLDTEPRYYFFILAILAMTIAMARGLRRARAGRVLIGLRENDRAAMAYGISAR